MKIKKQISQALLLVAAIAMLYIIPACNSGSTPRSSYDNYPEVYYPAKVTVTFPQDSNSVAAPTFHIDNNGMKIYNTDPLPYETEVDSAYLNMVISSTCEVHITNKKTGVRKEWHTTDTAKIDIQGGLLTIEIKRPSGNENVLKYDLYVRIYGYNPNKMTWASSTSKLPIASDDGNIIAFNSVNYWVARNGNTTSLYKILSAKDDRFENVSDAQLPPTLQPKSIKKAHNGLFFAITDEGDLYTSSDLKVWNKRDIGDIKLTMLLYDRELIEGNSVKMSAVGSSTSDPNTYYSYNITLDEITQEEEIDSSAPIKNAYVYTYITEEVNNANIIGGVTADNSSVKVNRFTTDGIVWAPMPYAPKDAEYPISGALYIPYGDRTIYLIGGLYRGNKSNNKILRSDDRGISWQELSKDEEISDEFAARTGIAGMIQEDGDNIIFYLYGGKKSNGEASNEIWKGYVDRSAGILNDIN